MFVASPRGDNRATRVKREKGLSGIWLSAEEVAKLPMSGPAWDRLKAVADKPAGQPQIRDPKDHVDVRIMAKALVARTGETNYRDEVIDACMAVIGTAKGGNCLALGRNLAADVIAHIF